MTQYGKLLGEEMDAHCVDENEPSITTKSAKQGEVGHAKTDKNSREQQTTTFAIHKTKIVKTIRIDNNTIHILAAPARHDHLATFQIDNPHPYATRHFKRRGIEGLWKLCAINSKLS